MNETQTEFARDTAGDAGFRASGQVEAGTGGMVPEENSGRVIGVTGCPDGRTETGLGPSETPPDGFQGEGTEGTDGTDGGSLGERTLPGALPGELCDAGRPGDEWRVEEANRRLGILQTFEQLVAGGEKKATAAAKVGESYVTLWRWRKRFAEDGFNGLLPETENCGRKTVFEQLGLTQEQVEQIRDEVKGLNLDLKSTTAALRVYANSDRCPAELARVILDPTRCSKHALPPSLREAVRVRRGTKRSALDRAHEGPRSLSLGGIWTPRFIDILEGDIFVSDDTTPIWGWWVPWEKSKEYPFGVKLLQGQLLPIIDVASQAPLTHVLIAREKSSYRAADIWHLFGHTFDTIGLPRLGFQLERGSWEANIVRGQEVTWDVNEVTYSRRVGGLRQLPTNITQWHREKFGEGFAFPKTLQTWTSYLPKTKSIEAWFNRSQTFEGTLWGCLGRDQMRRPYEKAKKIFGACQRNMADPRLHFLSQTELVTRLNEMLRYLGNEPMEGEVFHGIPIQRFEAAVKQYPLFVLEPEMQWLYRRDWAVVQITQGWARVRLTDPIEGRRYSLFYCNPEVFAQHEGEEVAVYFDREEFERPAQIVLARTGDYLCEAQYEERRGSFLSGDATGHDVRKRWREAVMSCYGTIVKHAPSRQVPAEIAQRREDAKAEAENGQKVVDGRPAAAAPQEGRSALAAPTAEEWEKRQARLARQADIAARLHVLAGE